MDAWVSFGVGNMTLFRLFFFGRVGSDNRKHGPRSVLKGSEPPTFCSHVFPRVVFSTSRQGSGWLSARCLTTTIGVGKDYDILPKMARAKLGVHFTTDSDPSNNWPGFHGFHVNLAL